MEGLFQTGWPTSRPFFLHIAVPCAPPSRARSNQSIVCTALSPRAAPVGALIPPSGAVDLTWICHGLRVRGGAPDNPRGGMPPALARVSGTLKGT